MKIQQQQNQRSHLQEIFLAAVDAVSGKTAVKEAFKEKQYCEQYHVIAIGKAGDSMLQGVPENQIKSALVISKHDHISSLLKKNPGVICIESDHPTPKSASIKAGEILLNYLAELPAEEPCLFLISGGASSLVEVLEEGWSLADLQALTDYLLANAYPITEMNAIRKRVSKIKGGSLWAYLKEREVICLMISDVPDDDPKVIGSGLLFPSLEEDSKDIPPSFYTFSESNHGHVFPDLTPKKTVTPNKNFRWQIVACLSDAKAAANKKAISLGYETEVMQTFLDGDASEVAVDCVNKLIECPNILTIWGGETTVHLPENAGKGGRNQHLALSAAIKMEQEGLRDIFLLAAGTDGSDGLTKATGALVDADTIKRGQVRNLSASEYLLRADSNSFFSQTGDLIETGATGTNVMDLLIGIRST